MRSFFARWCRHSEARRRLRNVHFYKRLDDGRFIAVDVPANATGVEIADAEL